MALSFEESKKKLIQQAAATPMMAANAGIMTLSEMGNNDMPAHSEWTRSDKYTWNDEYSDDKMSYVDKNKNITVDESQINMTQEENSQYIPFEMPRYYDGFDLMSTALSIHYVTPDRYSGTSAPINVSYDTAHIRFGWLVDGNVTHMAGNVKFEIQAIGINANGKAYVWKSKPFEQINVLQSLNNNRVIELDDSWVQTLVTDIVEEVTNKVGNLQMGEKVDAAENAVIEAGKKVDEATAKANEAAEAATRAEEAVSNAESLVRDVLSDYATTEYVNEAISQADISDKLNDYYTKEQVDEALANVDLTDYATTQYVDELTDINTANITALGNTLEELQEVVDDIDKSPRITYDIEYNDPDNPEVGENVFVFYQVEGEERTPLKSFTIVGGNGDGTSGSLTINRITNSPIVKPDGEKILITYYFSGTDASGDIISEGKYTWKIGSKVIASGTAYSGENTFDITNFVTTTEQKFLLTITDDEGGLVTKSWKAKKVDISITSTFDDTSPRNGSVTFDYTPYGSVTKTIHFVLDGEELGTEEVTSSGVPKSYPIPPQSHGSHLLEVYVTAIVDNKMVGRDEVLNENGDFIRYDYPIKVVKDIMWRDEDSEVPIIGCTTRTINATQYDTVNIEYIVYDPSTETPTVTWSIGDEVIIEETLTKKNENRYYEYSYKANTPGEFTFTIRCGESEPKEITINVEELNIDVDAVTGEAFDFNPSLVKPGESWTHNDVTMSVSDNFDWDKGGYQLDENNDRYFCVKAGTEAYINYDLFGNDPTENGKEFKLIFRTKNIRKRDTSFLSCMSNNIGLDMKVEYATLYETNGSLKSNYCEDTIIEYEFNINKKSNMLIVMTYEDGTPSKPYKYTNTSSFKQISSVPITIGSKDCDIHIYRMKVYEKSLTDGEILNNFILDARNADEMLARYKRNQIYTNNKLIATSASGGFNADALMEAAPDLRYIFLEVPQFTNDKENNIDGCTVYFRYPNGTRPQDNWDCTGVTHRGQGTSSNDYGYAGRNIDLCMDGAESLFTWTNEDGEIEKTRTITLTDTSVPTDYLNIKVNIASSENTNNAQLTRRFNEYQPFLRYARKKDSKVKDTMEFYNCVVFIRETGEAEDGIEHREFNDNDWHFYAIGNVGDSKKTDDTRVNDAGDPTEHIIEISDVDKPLSAFPTGKEGHSICPISEWRKGNVAYDILHSTEYVYDKKGKFKSFGGATYEFRYEKDGITEEQREANINVWRNLYKFIVTSTNEEFYANLKNYFVVDSALYYYLFTERYTMVDNRAKNSFWHYGKVYISEARAQQLGEDEASCYIIDNDAAAINDGYRYDLTFGYDFDTALGIDNTGDHVFSYGKEDTDYYIDGDPSSGPIFRVADSVFFCRLRDLFSSEMQAMYKSREDMNAWSAKSLIEQWDNAQAQFPEELWRLDYERKYYRTYTGQSIDNSINTGDGKGAAPTFLIGKFFGRKKYARREFETNQEIYFATKYFGNKILANRFYIRGNDPGKEDTNYSLTLVPYSDMYVCVQYTSTGTPTHQRVKAGQTCVFENNSNSMDFIYVYAANYIQEVGDLSKCYISDNDFSSATRLQKLVIGSNDDGYENTFMSRIVVENNPLLEHLDLTNVSGINTTIDVKGCPNLKKLYAKGTNATGVEFADGGLLHTAHLPSVTSLSMKNLSYLKDSNFKVESYDNLYNLTVENTPGINTYNIVTQAPKLQILRLTNLKWEFEPKIEDCAIFNRLLSLDGYNSAGTQIDYPALSGSVTVGELKEYDSYKFKEVWPDLTINADNFIDQYIVTFKNADGTILETQYVDRGGKIINPSTREENPLIPTLDENVRCSYEFKGWDTKLDDVILTGDITITATYNEIPKEYTVQYVSKGNVIQSGTGYYGDYVPYEGDIPTWTADENIGIYRLFKRWDKSGFINGEESDLPNNIKTITAEFDKCSYEDGYFEGKELEDLTPVELYALTKLHKENKVEIGEGKIAELNDTYTITLGHDFEYDDIDSEVLIGEKTEFNEDKYINTGIKLFEEDRDFVLAIDYEMPKDSTISGVLAQCYQDNGSDGFRLCFNKLDSKDGGYLKWGTTFIQISEANEREMMVLRHKKGESGIHVYTSNLNEDESKYHDLSTAKGLPKNAELIFGAANPESGQYKNYGKGIIHWAKIWYGDLGENDCKQLVIWTHETVKFDVCSYGKYYLSDVENDTLCSFSLLATNALRNVRPWNQTDTNDGGWAESYLNKFINSRLYNAMPIQMKNILKRVKTPSSDGYPSGSNRYTEVTYPACYISIPSILEIYGFNPNYLVIHKEPYASEGEPMVNISNYQQAWRPCESCYLNENSTVLWTRSPGVTQEINVDYVYILRCMLPSDGQYRVTYSLSTSMKSKNHILMLISF